MKTALLTRFVLAPLMIFACMLIACPGTPAAKSTENAVIKIADDACQEVVDAGLAPEWVSLVCNTAAGAVTVLLPRQEWHSIKARHIGTVDAGPGK